MKTKVLGPLSLALVMTGLAATVGPNGPKLTTREVMRAKLESSQ